MQPKNKKKEINLIYKTYASLFLTGSGIHVLNDLKKTLKHGENIHYKNMEVNDLYYELGRQSVINDIIKMIEIGQKG